MAPKLWKGAKKRKLIAKNVKKEPMVAIKGLAGFRKASAVFSGMVDKGVAQQNAALASRAVVIGGLDARLININPSKKTDMYYVLQGLEDPKVSVGKPNCYAYQRWGRLGTGGVCRLEGPLEQSKVEARLFRVFKAKTGADWGSPKLLGKARPGKYWLVAPSEPDPRATWQYYVGDAVDRKHNGWYDYDNDAVLQVEELYAEHLANKKSKNHTSTRYVKSGRFTYCIDFDSLYQRNMTTLVERKIRRRESGSLQRAMKSSSGVAPKAAMGFARADSGAGLVHSDTSATIPAIFSESEWNQRALALRQGSKRDSTLANDARKNQSRTVAQAPSSRVEKRKSISHEQLDDLSVPALRDWLRGANVSASGSKSDLVHRVRTLMEE